MTRHVSRRGALTAVAWTAAAALGGCLGARIEDGGDRPRTGDSPENAGELGTPAEEITVTISSEPWPEFAPQIVTSPPVRPSSGASRPAATT